MLHIIKRLDNIESATRYSTSGDEFLLVEEAVYAINPNHKYHSILNIPSTKALLADVEARGIINKCAQVIELVGFDGFVDLTAEHSKSITW
jgi:tRNA 2-thiouridine synthesizing protein B